VGNRPAGTKQTGCAGLALVFNGLWEPQREIKSKAKKKNPKQTRQENSGAVWFASLLSDAAPFTPACFHCFPSTQYRAKETKP